MRHRTYLYTDGALIHTLNNRKMILLLPIRGTRNQLTGARINATDLRAGAAMVVAGLMASGVTDIGGVDYILRGYENIDKKLASLGAQIERLEG